MNKVLKACITLQDLRITKNILPAPELTSRPGMIFADLPVFSSLRRLDLELDLDNKIICFVKDHYTDLTSLRLHLSSEEGEVRHLYTGGKSVCSRYSLPLPPSCSFLDCSTYLASVFVPRSHVTDLCLHYGNNHRETHVHPE